MNIPRLKKPLLKRIFENASDLHVRARIIYTNEDVTTAYIDPTGVFVIDADTLKDLYLKGLIVSDNGVLYTPISMEEDNGEVTVTYIKPDSVTGDPVLHSIVGVDCDLTLDPPLLVALNIGGKVLNPAFDPLVFDYTLTTMAESDIVSFETLAPEAEVVVELNDTPIDDYAEGVAWEPGENVLAITVTFGGMEYTYTITVLKEVPPAPPNPTLSAFAISDVVLEPVFSSSVTEYDALATEASGVITLTAAPEGATVVVTFNSEPVADLETPLVWEEGENEIVVTVTAGEVDKVYTITVTLQDD